MDIEKAAQPHQTPQYTPQQKEALQHLHTAATQFEGVFLDMMFSAMRDTVPQTSIFGKESSTEGTFQTMLDEQRAQQISQSGSLGIAKVLEQQLKDSVLADADREAKAPVQQELEP
jgi:flagellar protein FlgJ